MHTVTVTSTPDRPRRSSPPPVDDLLRVYLGQCPTACATARTPDDGRDDAGDGWDLWDRLGDFA